jgi:tRNA threonylcarbamoyladenosine biosynthesis protein TsaE
VITQIQEIISTSEEQTLELARTLARSLSRPAHILLYGDLGAGKTLFTKGLAEEFGVDDLGEVSSPTFTLINQYKGRIPVYHIDLYRIDTGRLEGLGLEEIFDVPNAAVIIEWAERLGDFATPGAVEVFFSYVDDHSRKIRICPSSP